AHVRTDVIAGHDIVGRICADDLHAVAAVRRDDVACGGGRAADGVAGRVEYADAARAARGRRARAIRAEVAVFDDVAAAGLDEDVGVAEVVEDETGGGR